MPELIITYDNGHAGSVIIDRMSAEMPHRISQALRIAGGILERQIKKNLSGPSHSRYPGNNNPFPGAISDHLRGSVTSIMPYPNEVRVGPGGFASRYAAIQERGGVTHPRVSAKSRLWLGMNKGIWLKVGTILNVVIKARAYVKPAWETKRTEVLDTISRRLMGGL